MMKVLIQNVAAHIRQKFEGEGSGDDLYHVNRVWKLTRRIGQAEGANLEIVELGALVHDIADWKFTGGDETVGPLEAEKLLNRLGVEPGTILQVVDIVKTISFKGAGVQTPMRILEGKCVQGADRSAPSAPLASPDASPMAATPAGPTMNRIRRPSCMRVRMPIRSRKAHHSTTSMKRRFS